jgi:hypothetical protein
MMSFGICWGKAPGIAGNNSLCSKVMAASGLCRDSKPIPSVNLCPALAQQATSLQVAEVRKPGTGSEVPLIILAL